MDSSNEIGGQVDLVRVCGSRRPTVFFVHCPTPASWCSRWTGRLALWTAGRTSSSFLSGRGRATPIMQSRVTISASCSYRPVLGACGPHRKDDKAAFLVGVLDAHLDLGGDNQSELLQHLTRPADQPSTIVGRTVPIRRVAEQRPRITRAESADDHMMQRRRIFEYAATACSRLGCPNR